MALTMASLVMPITPSGAQTSTASFQTADGNRTMLVTDHGRGRPAPLVIVLHDALGSSELVRRSMTWDAIAARDGLIVAYPQGLRQVWNDARPDGAIVASGARADDIAFLRRLVGDLVAQGKVDRRRVYVAGVGQGGRLVYRLACDAGDVFGAAAALLATLPASLVRDCRGAPVPLMIMAGTEDPLSPWGGNPGRQGGEGATLSSEATFAFFRERHSCRGAEGRAVPDRTAEDGSKVVVMEGAGCRVSLRLYHIEGGGHRVPGLVEQPPLSLRGPALGRQNRDIDAAEEIWAFFRDKSR
ncbi:alpha/beta hydrolase family esterase [Phreatobacter aquaticus]|nr:PHB depolymerase family esterase [Phreatobacter aquaticus]